MKKKEIIIIAVIAAAAAAAILLMHIFRSDKASGVTVAVQYQNRIVYEFDPAFDQEYELTGDYGKMVIEVKDMKWHVKEVECPNHICEHMGWMGPDDLMPITCLPNNLIIYLEEKPE